MVLKWYVFHIYVNVYGREKTDIVGFGGIRGKSTNPCVDPLANQQWGLW